MSTMYYEVLVAVILSSIRDSVAVDYLLLDQSGLDPWSQAHNGSLMPCELPERMHCYVNSTGPFFCVKHGTTTTYYINETEVECYPCFMPHQCLKNNHCSKGSAGRMCEKCERGTSSKNSYYNLGNNCQPCTVIPWNLLVFLLFLVPVVSMIIYNGLTVTVAIKIRQIVNMIQLVMLTLSVKVLWKSTLMLNVLQQFAFILGSVESTYTVGCYTDLDFGMHYVQWLFVSSTISFILVSGCIIDMNMKKFIKFEPDEDLVDRMWRWRMMMRRLIFAIIIMLFSPLLSATCQSYSCAVILQGYSKQDKDYYLIDQEDAFTCENLIHQFVNLILFLMAVSLCIVAPMLMIFAGLTGNKWNTLDRDMVIWGWYYESFKPRFAFWDAFPLMLRMVYVACTDVYDISPKYSLTMMLTCTLIYLVGVIVCRPYKEVELVNYKVLDIHNVFEGMSVLGVIFFQIIALIEVFVGNVPGLTFGYALTLSILGTIILVWIILCWHTIRENPIIEFDDLELPVYNITDGYAEDMWNLEDIVGVTMRSSRCDRRRKAVSIEQPHVQPTLQE